MKTNSVLSVLNHYKSTINRLEVKGGQPDAGRWLPLLEDGHAFSGEESPSAGFGVFRGVALDSFRVVN